MTDHQTPIPPRKLGGVLHTYLGYDPKRFPSPTTPPPDLASAAMEHMLAHGSTRRLTDEQLANAITLDPSQIAGLGPSLESLIAMLEERKRKILETYDPKPAIADADRRFSDAATETDPPNRKLRDQLDRALRAKSIPELERLWYRAEREPGPLAGQIMRLVDALGALYETEDLDARWDFTGREPLDVESAIAVKEELETIEKLLEQLRDAMENAQIAVIDMDQLRRFVDEAGVEQLEGLADQIREYMEQEAERQGLERDAEDGGYRVSPKAMRLFQTKLLREVFSSLDESRSGRHEGPVVGEGAVETPKTRTYEFGDSPAHMDTPNTLVNAAIRERSESDDPRWRILPTDIDVHDTKNTPKCATSVLLDMSGSMRWGGQYIQAKRMALALDGLIRTEYPGDHLSFFEMFSFAKPRHASEIAGLMPKPVTIREPLVQLRVDMSDPDITESMVHPHFTNIQHALRLSRLTLSAQDTPNRQVFLITDGLPTAHLEDEHLYLLYPPHPLTEEATMREAAMCAREGITINIFLIPSWSQDSDDIAFAHRLAETTKGRVFFTGGEDLDRFVLWDYVNHRRRVIG